MRWGIMGTGTVAGKFAIALQNTPGAELALVGSRSGARAQKFARELGIPKAIEGYAAAAAADVDIFYIATPPSEHLANALLCIAAAKSVLVEKPFASDALEAQAIAVAARASGVFCMEGMWTRFMPAVVLAKAMLEEGAIGEPRALMGSFAVAERPDHGSSLFNAGLGGGALAHRGVYPISLALHLLGAAVPVGASAIRDGNGVDEDVTAILRHQDGALSTVHASLRATGTNDLTILGSKGRMRLRGPIYRPYAVEIALEIPRSRSASSWGRMARLKEGALAQATRRKLDEALRLAGGTGGKVINAPYKGNGYIHQIEAVMGCVREGRLEHPLMTMDDSAATVRIMDQIRTLWMNRDSMRQNGLAKPSSEGPDRCVSE